jgi:hypothetical protein
MNLLKSEEDNMTFAAEQILGSFDSLSDAEKHQVAVEILRRVSGSTSGDLADDELSAAADQLFCDLDAEEAKHAQP